MALSPEKQQGVVAASLPPWRRAGQRTKLTSKDAPKEKGESGELQKQQAALQQQLQAKVEPSYLACAKRVLQGAGKENQHRYPGLSQKNKSSQHFKLEPPLSDCETSSGDSVSSQQSDTHSHESPHIAAIVPLVSLCSAGTSTPPTPPPPPVEAPPFIPEPEEPGLPPDSEASCSLDRPFVSVLDSCDLDGHSSNPMQRQTTEERKLSTEAKLFLPRSLNARPRINASAPVWTALAAAEVMSMNRVATAVASVVPKSPPSVPVAPPPGLSMPLRSKAAAFVPSHMKAQAATMAA